VSSRTTDRGDHVVTGVAPFVSAALVAAMMQRHGVSPGSCRDGRDLL
jgi:hypothetical protein